MSKKKIDYAILDKFNFKTSPIGVKLTVKRVEGIKRITKKMTFCEMIKHAQDGNAFYADMEDHTCDAGLFLLGM